MQILNTKFHIPRLRDPSIVYRKDLVETMHDALDNRIILVSAPAGFGKTTFLSQWAQTYKIIDQTAWLSLDEGDNYLVSFWTYVIEAIHKIAPGVCAPLLDLLKCPANESFENIIIKLINCLDRLKSPVVLILDDFHVITDKEILSSFNFFVDHPVKGLLIVLSTRKTPPLGLSRLRLSGRFREIFQPELEFSMDETESFINTSGGLCVDREKIESLNRKTEGWIAGLKLAMISLKESADREKFIGEFTGENRYVFDYLVEEVLSLLPEDIKAFMLRLSVVSRFNAGLCTELTGAENAFSHLQYMEKHNLFLVPLDDKREWFRYHHLFRACLKTILEQSRGENSASLYLKALLWFEKNGFHEDAFHMAVESEDMEAAATIFAGIIPDIYSSGGEQFLLPWFKALDEETILNTPILAGYYLWVSMITGNFEVIAKIEPLLKGNHSEEDENLLRGLYEAFQGYYLFYKKGDLFISMEKCKKALGLIPERHYSVRRIVEHLVSIFYRFQGDLQSAMAFSRERHEDNLFMSALTLMNIADQYMAMGNLSGAYEILKRKLDNSVASFQGELPDFFGFIYAIMGVVLREKNRLAEAKKMLSKGVVLCVNTGFIELIPVAYMEQAKLYADLREFDKAHKDIDFAINICEKNSFWALGEMKTWKARFYLMEGKTEYAAELASTFTIFKEMKISFIRSMEYIFLIRYLIYTEEYEKAAFIIDLMIKEDIPLNRNGRLLECLLLQTRLLFMQNRENDAMKCLERAFSIADGQGYVRLFLDEYPYMEALFKKALHNGDVPEYLKESLTSMEISPGNEKKKNISVMVHDYEETFNKREIEILDLMQQGASNKEIAADLYLSVNTVRWYARRVFAKLDVNTRGRAASKALELGLI